MNTTEEIERLLALAEPLRAMHDDDPAKEPLTGIVDEINKLRAIEAKQPVIVAPAAVEGADAAPTLDEQLQAAGIEVDKRWGEKRKLAELAKVKP